MFRPPLLGVKLFFRQNIKYFPNQCMSDHIFWGVLYYICENFQISPPPTRVVILDNAVQRSMLFNCDADMTAYALLT